MMKYMSLLIVIIFIISCSNSDTAVTHTGNPVNAVLSYSADTSSVRSKYLRADSLISSIKVTSAKIVISEIRLRSSDHSDSLNFKFNEPVVLDLSIPHENRIIDSAIALSGAVYERVRFRIDELREDDGAIFKENPELQNKSIFITGSINDDTLKTFTFSTDLSNEIDYEFSEIVTIPNISEYNFLMVFITGKWFINEDGNIMDPTDDSNKTEIEDNIKQALEIHSK